MPRDREVGLRIRADELSFAEDGTTVERRHVSRVVAALRPHRSGGAVCGIDRGFALEQPDGTIDRLGDLWPDEGIRMNEGAADPDGRFYPGDEPRVGSLFRAAPGVRGVPVREFGG